MSYSKWDDTEVDLENLTLGYDSSSSDDLAPRLPADWKPAGGELDSFVNASFSFCPGVEENKTGQNFFFRLCQQEP